MIRTINDIYLDLRAEFRKKGIAGYEVEARELVTFALELDYDQFSAKRNQFIFEKDEKKKMLCTHFQDKSRFVEIPKDIFVLNPVLYTLREQYFAHCIIDCVPINNFIDLVKYMNFYGCKNIFFTYEEAKVALKEREKNA